MSSQKNDFSFFKNLPVLGVEIHNGAPLSHTLILFLSDSKLKVKPFFV